MKEVKQVIVIRKDLRMRRGKEVAQGAHAAIGAMYRASKEDLDLWFNTGTKKICVLVNSEEELMSIADKASQAYLPVYLVRDAGLTEFEGPTMTSVGIGPADADEINKITGHLTLY